jgi:hypothetical protein
MTTEWKHGTTCPQCRGRMYERTQFCLSLRRTFIVVGCHKCFREWDREALRRRDPPRPARGVRQ